MELLILYLIAFLFFLLIFVKITKKQELRQPPGPTQLPIIGNLHQLAGGLTHHLVTDLSKKYGPLMLLKIGEVPCCFVSSPEIVKEIFKNHDIIFSQRPSSTLVSKVIGYKNTGLATAPYGSYWRSIRKIAMTELLSPKRVQSFRSIREDEVLKLIRSISNQEGSAVNLSERLFLLTYTVTARAAFGNFNKKREAFIHLEPEFTKLISTFCLADVFPSIKLLQVLSLPRYKLVKLHKQIDEILEDILVEHREKDRIQKQGYGEETEDLVDVLLGIQQAGDSEHPLTDDNIKSVVLDLFSAGGETSKVTEWAMSEMIRSPNVMKKAQDEVRNAFRESGNVDESKVDELKYLKAVVKETLRLHPNVPLSVPRESSEECEVHGYTIPAKTRLFVNVWAMARDPQYWPEAEKFIPDRFLESEMSYKGNHFEYLPFGFGRRICPGISFAVANIELSLAQLLFHFDWKIPGDRDPADLDMTENSSALVSRKNDLQLIPILCSHSSLKEKY